LAAISPEIDENMEVSLPLSHKQATCSMILACLTSHLAPYQLGYPMAFQQVMWCGYIWYYTKENDPIMLKDARAEEWNYALKKSSKFQGSQ